MDNAAVMQANTAMRSLGRFYAQQVTFALKIRISATLSALRTIARSLAAYPGRKSIIWVTGAFPLNPYEPNLSYISGQLQETINLLSSSRIAVYGVDARGLVGAQVMDASKPGTDPLTGQLLYGDAFGKTIKESADQLLNSQDSMERFAEFTGGKSYTNRNDIGNAVGLCMANGAAYYELAYHLPRKEADGKFHHIQVKVNAPGAGLQYRRGYYAVEIPRSDEAQKLRQLDLIAALTPDVPQANSVIFDARVIPPSVSSSRVSVPVEFMVNTKNLNVVEQPDGTAQFDLEFHIVAFRPGESIAARNDKRVVSKASRRNLAAMVNSGLPYTMHVELAPGHYTLRLSVRDSQTGALGTVDAPLSLQMDSR